MHKIIPTTKKKKRFDTALVSLYEMQYTPSFEPGGQKEYSASLYVWYLKTRALARYDPSPTTFFSHVGTLAGIT